MTGGSLTPGSHSRRGVTHASDNVTRYRLSEDGNTDISDSIAIQDRNVDIDDRYMDISDRYVDIMYRNIDAILQS